MGFDRCYAPAHHSRGEQDTDSSEPRFCGLEDFALLSHGRSPDWGWSLRRAKHQGTNGAGLIFDSQILGDALVNSRPA